MARLHLPSVDEMTPEQRDVHDEVVSGVRGRLVGPLRAVIHSPDLARRWSRLGEYLRFSTCLPKKLNELAIIVTGRRWNSQLEFLIHAEAAVAAGLDPALHRSHTARRGADIRRRGGGRGLRVRPAAAADRHGGRQAPCRRDGALGRPRRRRADRRHRLLHDGLDDAERARDPDPGRRPAAARAAGWRRPDDTAGRACRPNRHEEDSDMAESYECFKVEVADLVATVRLARPPVNAQNRRFREELIAIFDTLSDRTRRARRGADR